MPITERWLLPEGVDEILPEEAEDIESARRNLIDLFYSWGYELVIPPLIEYLESLFTGTGTDLELQTFKLTDQLTGRLMGIRADITPQVARISAHRLKRKGVTRLCYIGSVLHTLPKNLGGTRNPIQVGAELYGHEGIESDIEIIRLAVESLFQSGVGKIYLDLGHVGIFQNIISQARLSKAQEYILLDMVQRKAQDEIENVLIEYQVDPKYSEMLMALIHLHGGEEIMKEAEQYLIDNEAIDALTTLKKTASAIQRYFPSLPIHFDLAELRGYHYHTGLVFSVYTPKYGQAIVQGGRYDGIGQDFGYAQPATGFSIDLKKIITPRSKSYHRIYACWIEDAKFEKEVLRLRQQGEKVVYGFSDTKEDYETLGCNRRLVLEDGQWKVIRIK
ncbi:ATP phosphoribosyltransferase regulatory subunit [Candidatus Nitrosacidococcus tergens]|uniref:ATP phosphoribosyltransferase regulatory subunit n=1 Tax=Candidatus Nitrosacidococcus tergens TaxID=553981 RepID=A0A7G1QBE1_9GAMM|nr:ATP phosphoribosyltransferase regulatory subunit [Candidatus Nitrosacidococcus tergens]CAB1277354.1 ATP phosphoribosyltransferase regulatory subunit [Candidatus Nitrosacidococcus tergens]